MILTVTLNPCIDKTYIVNNCNYKGKNRVQEVETIAGGKGINVARMANNLNSPALALCLLGGETGKKIEELLIRDDVTYNKVFIKDGNREVITVWEDDNKSQTVFFEPGPTINREERRTFLAEYEKLLSNSEIVVLGGALPDNKTFAGIYQQLIEMARKHEKKVVLDSHDRGLKEGIEAIPYLVTPNREEAGEMIDKPVNNKHDYQLVAKYLLDKGIKVVVITLGEKGAVLFTDDIYLKVLSPPIDVVNPVGSGDSFLAGLITGMMRNYSWSKSLKLGVAAGTANASVWTAANCEKETVDKIMTEISSKI